jgi:hypothetical protein
LDLCLFPIRRVKGMRAQTAGRGRFPPKISHRKTPATPSSLSAPRPSPLKEGRIRIFIGKSEGKSFCQGPGPPSLPRRIESPGPPGLSPDILDSRSPAGFHYFPTIDEGNGDVKPTGTFCSRAVASSGSRVGVYLNDGAESRLGGIWRNLPAGRFLCPWLMLNRLISERRWNSTLGL